MQDKKQPKLLGITAKNAKSEIQDNKLTIKSAEIHKIDFDLLSNNIKEIEISNSIINCINFSNTNDIKMTFENCVFSDEIVAINKTFENEVIFLQCEFDSIVDFENSTFHKMVEFNTSHFKSIASFKETKFQSQQNSFREAYFEDECYFYKTEFNGEVDFGFTRFKDETIFIDTILDNYIFNHTEFNKTKFVNIDSKNTETYTFNHSTFKDILSFENLNISKLEFDNVVFNGIVTFDKTKLGNKPQFINCTFSNQFNIEHKNIQYNYKEIEEIKDYDSLLNYRDLFRKLKSNRIAHHNLIDASELHTQELYLEN